MLCGMRSSNHHLCCPSADTAIFIILISILTSCNSDCIFDAIRQTDIVQANVVLDYNLSATYVSSASNIHKRSVNDDVTLDSFFRPIRLLPHFTNLTQIDAVKKARLRKVISATVSVISRLFSVIPIRDPLLLARKGCSKVWLSGPNAGRCAAVTSEYRGEYCIDSFAIPPDHLEGLSVWNNVDAQPYRKVFLPGHGLQETDYVMYIESKYTSACLLGGLNVIAYATYCQLGPDSRPVAGYINICPQVLADQYYDELKVFWTALHEMFHALGFSADLFSKFQTCVLNDNLNITCRPYVGAKVQMVNGAMRLVTNKVSQLSSEHFGCRLRGDTFGPILDSTNGAVGSHWDAAFMQGSIMMPTITLPHLMLIDNITLAVFEDSGWYKVNYSYADKFVWGKGLGCNFGLDSYCSRPDNIFFCDGSVYGCHYMHLDKGICDTTPFLHQCRIFQFDPQGSCQSAPTVNYEINQYLETFSPTSRCFESSLSLIIPDTAARSFRMSAHTTSDPNSYTAEMDFETTTDESESSYVEAETVGRCYEHRCSPNGDLFIGLNSNWILCPYGQFITVPGYNGVLRCPLPGILCEGPNSLWSVISTTTVSPASFTATTDSNRPASQPTVSGSLCVAVRFSCLPGTSAMRQLLVKTMLKTLSYEFKISASRLSEYDTPCVDNNSSSGQGSDSVVFFTVYPSRYANDGPTTDIFVHQLMAVVNNSQFVITVANASCRASAVWSWYITESPSKLDHDDKSVARLVATVIGSFAIVALCLFGVCMVRWRRELRRCCKRSPDVEIPHSSVTMVNTGDASSEHVVIQSVDSGYLTEKIPGSSAVRPRGILRPPRQFPIDGLDKTKAEFSNNDTNCVKSTAPKTVESGC